MSDTIAAVATARGAGALGIIRISGSDSGRILSAVVPGTSATTNSRTMTHGLARDPDTGAVLDEVLCFFAPGPATATGEDVAEIHGHGGTLVLGSLLEACVRSGARPARPGEFTHRAFANGKLDLTQAEAVMALIGARSNRAARTALKQLSGNMGARLGTDYNTLTNVAAHLEAGLDFPDDDLPLEEMGRMADTLDDVVGHLADAMGSFTLGSRLEQGATVAICGPANAGKSSILNKLVDEDRALVDPEPGTTRDVVEARAEIRGVPLSLLDTAGLRSSPGRVEQRGMERSVQAAATSDMVIIVLDGRAQVGEEDLRSLEKLVSTCSDTGVLVVANKSDLEGWSNDVPGCLDDFPRVGACAVSDGGIDGLVEELGKLLEAGCSHQEVILTTSRQHAAVRGAHKHACRSRDNLRKGNAPELAATDLRWARESLASLWGRNVTDEVIDAIFSSFCLGK